MSVTPSTVNNQEPAFHSDVECDDDNDDTSVEAQFGDVSSESSSVSVRNMTAVGECQLEAAGQLERTGSESEDSSSRSVDNISNARLTSLKTDDVSSVNTVQVLLDSHCDYEKSNNNNNPEPCQSDNMMLAHNNQHKKMKQMLLRRASIERTALWCAVSTAMTTDRCDSVADSVNVVSTDSDELLTVSQCDVKRLSGVLDVGMQCCNDTNNCDVTSITNNSRRKCDSEGLCDSGRQCSSTGESVRGSVTAASVPADVSDECQQLSNESQSAAAVSLPLVEDGLSSGHVTDDDEEEEACSAAETGVELMSSLEAGHVEELMSEMRSAMTLNRHTSATCNHVVIVDSAMTHLHSNDDPQEPVWITRCMTYYMLNIFILYCLKTSSSP